MLSEGGKLDHCLIFFKIRPCHITSYSRRLFKRARDHDLRRWLVRDLLEVLCGDSGGSLLRLK